MKCVSLNFKLNSYPWVFWQETNITLMWFWMLHRIWLQNTKQLPIIVTNNYELKNPFLRKFCFTYFSFGIRIDIFEGFHFYFFPHFLYSLDSASKSLLLDLPFLRFESGSNTPLLKAAAGSWTQDLRLSMLCKWGSFIRRSLYAVNWLERQSKAAMLCTNSGTRQVYVLSAWQ